MFLLFPQNIKKQFTPIISVSSCFVLFAIRCLCLGLLTLYSSLMRVITIARLFKSPGVFISYRCITSNPRIDSIDKHKSNAIVLYFSQPALRIFFAPHRYLTVLFFFMRLFFMPSTNNNFRLGPHIFCFWFRTLTLFRLWL